MTNYLFFILYTINGDDMKKIIPYILSLCLGVLLSFVLNNNKNILSSSIKAKGFQLGVFNSFDLANEYMNKYPSSIIIKDEDVYRVYISILTNPKCISRMEKYLLDKKIAFYKKDIIVSDKSLIKALNNYEKTMLDGNNDTFYSINKMIMDSYGGEI